MRRLPCDAAVTRCVNGVQSVASSSVTGRAARQGDECFSNCKLQDSLSLAGVAVQSMPCSLRPSREPWFGQLAQSVGTSSQPKHMHSATGSFHVSFGSRGRPTDAKKRDRRSSSCRASLHTSVRSNCVTSNLALSCMQASACAMASVHMAGVSKTAHRAGQCRCASFRSGRHSTTGHRVTQVQQRCACVLRTGARSGAAV